MNTFQMKKLLKNIKDERIKISSKIRFKIENIHGVKIEDVLKNLRNPDSLISVDEQPSRRPHDKTYGLVFEITKRKRLFVVVTYKTLKNKLYIVTAFTTTKKMEKLIKKPKIRY
ncbi:MAG: hypothetical protein GXO64_00050 [Candidatus Micrarchaeota archaeon]|nr:hypothetical protein [Candidatus Micrarchaeota archaeon]